MKHFYQGKIVAKEGKGKDLSSILQKASDHCTNLKECHHYLLSMELTEPDTIWITEVWDSKEAHDESLKNEKVGALIGQAMEFIGEPPSGGRK